LAKARWEETVALRTKNQSALDEIRGRRDRLLTVSGMCQFGGVAYSDCSYVGEQRDTVKLTAQRDIGVLAKTVGERDNREAREKDEYEAHAKTLAHLAAARDDKTNQKIELNNAIEKRLRQLGEGDSVRRTLSEWQEGHKAPETEKLRDVRANVADLEKKLDGAQLAKVSARQLVSAREGQISTRFAKLAEVFGAHGRYVPSDDRRPFQMLGADGDAYPVLAILLGDLACAEDGVDGGGGAHPGLLIFDCPREREMGGQVYARFLKLVDEVCRRATGLQVIIMTTTPPPGPLRERPTRILKLSRASDDDLLLKCRIENLLARGTPSSRDTSDEEEL
jgi:hypothetical protein